MLIRRVLLFFFILLAVNLHAQSPHYCISERFSESPLFTSAQIRKDTGVVFAYAHNPFANSTEALTMNIYYPDPSLDTLTKKPLILLVHGGSFVSGSIHDEDFFCEEYAKRGFVSASINYRLGWNCPYNSVSDFCTYCVGDTGYLKASTYMVAQDIRAALRFMGNISTGRGADPNWFFVGGTSAGSIACFHAALWTQAEANQFAPLAESVLGLLDTSGNSFPMNYTIRGITDNCGAIAGDSNLVAELTIPLVSFNDEFDCMVPSTIGSIFGCGCNSFYKTYGSGYLYDHQKAAGTCSELNTIYNSFGHCSYPAQMIAERSSCFFKRIMCSVCESDTNSNINQIKRCDSLGFQLEMGIDDFSVSLFPSPANDILTLNFSERVRHAGSFRCINYLGQEIFTQSYPYMTKKIELNISFLPSGIYFLVFDVAGQIPPVKLLVTQP